VEVDSQGSSVEGYGHLLLHLQPEYLAWGVINKEEGLCIAQSVKVSFPLSWHEITLMTGEP